MFITALKGFVVQAPQQQKLKFRDRFEVIMTLTQKKYLRTIYSTDIVCKKLVRSSTTEIVAQSIIVRVGLGILT